MVCVQFEYTYKTSKTQTFLIWWASYTSTFVHGKNYRIEFKMSLLNLNFISHANNMK